MAIQPDIQQNSEQLLDSLPSLSVEELEILVLRHNEAYFVHNIPEISDFAFDKLVERLRLLNPNSQVLQVIGAPSSEAIPHEIPMLSLDKCYDDETFLKWRKNVKGKIVAMPKIDGVACSIKYVGGKLTLAATRGDGFKGENITANVLHIKDVPHHIQLPDPTEVRGEVHMKLSRFKEHYAERFANPRNLAAGALKLKDSKKSAAYHLSFFPYDILGAKLHTEQEKFTFLKELGFLPPSLRILETDLEALQAFRDLVNDSATFNFETDGVVYRADSVAEQARLGVTAHHPKFAIAYKFQGESAQTQLLDVQWSVARTGVVTPVAIVAPVFVSGATVTRASLHNYGLFKGHDLRLKSLVVIVRRGGVIPHLERVLHREGEAYLAPTVCPSCSRELVVDGDFLRCDNLDTCPDVVVARVGHYCSAVDLLGFGEKLLKALARLGLATKPAHLYRLTPEKLMPLQRMGDKLAHKLVAAVQNKRILDLPTFISALGIEEVGPTVAETIAMHFPNLDALRKAAPEELSAIHGIGESIAQALVQGLKRQSDDIDDLLTEVAIESLKPSLIADSSHKFFGKSVLFTGKMAHLDRKSAQKKVRELGGSTPAQISGSIDYLVIGDDGSPLLGPGKRSTKHATAEKLIAGGAIIRVISETEFLTML